MMTEVSVRLLVPTLEIAGGVESGGNTRAMARFVPAVTVMLVVTTPRSVPVAVMV
jgi:hypothetical protein